MITKEAYLYLEQNYGDVASWAIWAAPDALPRSNTSDLTVFDNPALLDTLTPDYVFVGLNASSAHGDQKAHAGRSWYNFHSDYVRQNDFKLRYAVQGTPCWGSYITDVIKEYPEVNSGKVSAYLNKHPEIIKQNITVFVDEISHLGGRPVLIALGGAVYDVLKKHLDAKYKIVQIKHYAAYISKENYREEFLRALGFAADPIEQIIRETTEENQSKTDWTKAWSTKYPILKTYQAEVDIHHYAVQLHTMLTEMQATYDYTEQDAMLVLKDILAHEYMDSKKCK